MNKNQSEHKHFGAFICAQMKKEGDKASNLPKRDARFILLK